MKKIMLVAFIVLLHINLPPDNVEFNFAKDENVGFFDELALSMVTSQFVANWHYSNYIIFKKAYSREFKIDCIGFPFIGWGACSADK